MSKLVDWLRAAKSDGEKMDAKIIARAGEEYGAEKVSMAENVIRAAVSGAFAAAPPQARVHTITVLCALYCPHCGKEQPDDPNEECGCIEKH